MKRYLAYLKYVIKHKWYVFLGALMVEKSPHLIYRAIVHDLSKFYPSELFAYAKTFYKEDGTGQYNETPEFAMAWCHHQKRNKHHWQYWIMKWDRGDTETMPMDDIYIKEMIADWIGAGWIITGNKYNLIDFYAKNDTGRHLHPTTRAKVEEYLEKLKEMRDGI